MSRRNLRMFLGALAAAVTLAIGSPANAAFYNSNFDPLGPLSFSGTGLFELDDACLTVDGTYTGAFCHVSLLNATVDMTLTSTGDTGHLDFAPILPDSIHILDIIIKGGNLVGVDTDLIGWVFPGPCTGDLCGTPWWLQWTSSDVDPVFLYTGSCDFLDDTRICFPDDIASGIATHVTFTRVPEPGTLALLFAALGGWLVRRRKVAA